MTEELSDHALAQIELVGLTLEDYAFPAGWLYRGWWGDSCGCYDDRCSGHHHDRHEECPCLPVLIEQALKL